MVCNGPVIRKGSVHDISELTVLHWLQQTAFVLEMDVLSTMFNFLPICQLDGLH